MAKGSVRKKGKKCLLKREPSDEWTLKNKASFDYFLDNLDIQIL